MDWIKKKHDKFILLIAALILLASSIFLVVSASGFASRFAVPPENSRKTIEDPDFQAVQVAQDKLEAPVKWTPPGEAGLLVARPYIVRDGQLIEISADSEPIHPPVPNAWFLEYGLPIQDSNVLQLDTDDDGFINREEWKSRMTEQSTDPTDPDDHPDLATRLFLVDVVQNTFMMQFSAETMEGVFQINFPGTSRPTQFVEMGDRIQDTPFKVKEYDKKMETTTTGVEVNRSDLIVTNVESGVDFRLPIEQNTDVGDKTAVFEFRWKGTETVRRREDETFELTAGDDTVEMTVVEISEGQAVIERVSDGKRYEYEI
jgi:hypothetical protein